MLGKVPPEELRDLVFAGTGADDDAVLQGPAYGEDAAAIDLGEQVLVVSSDPISLAIERVGTLGVYVASNDVAASGADPRWLTNVLFLPDDDPTTLSGIVSQVDEAATAAGVAIVGGHAEYDPTRDRPLLSLTCMGLADEFVSSGGAEVGDAVVLTKGAAIEGTAILATDFRERLAGRVPDATLDAAAGFFDDVSVVADGRVLREYATAMHDPTEGGLVDGLVEMATASGTTFEIDGGAVPVREETVVLCDAMGVDPFRIFGSGALVATVPQAGVEAALADLRDAGIEAAVVGEVSADAGVPLRIDDEAFDGPVRDELYQFWE